MEKVEKQKLKEEFKRQCKNSEKELNQNVIENKKIKKLIELNCLVDIYKRNLMSDLNVGRGYTLIGPSCLSVYFFLSISRSAL